MSRLPHPVLAALLTSSVVVTVALGMFGWRLIDQQRTIDAKRTEERAGAAADAMTAAIRGRLAEIGDRLSAWLSDANSPLPAIDGAVVVAERSGVVSVAPAGSLPFLPVAPATVSTNSGAFAEAEALEFGSRDPAGAAARYRALATSPERRVRASALIRLGRVLRQTGDLRSALRTYEALSSLDDVISDELPAALVGLEGQRNVYQALLDRDRERAVAGQIASRIDAGAWPLTRGQAEHYREAVTSAPLPGSWALADAVGEVWASAGASGSSRGEDVVTKDGPAIFMLWRSSGSAKSVAAAFAQPFVASLAPHGSSWQLVDADDRPIAGDERAPSDSAARIVKVADGAWTLRVWPAAQSSDSTTSRTGLIAMMAATFVFIWGATFFMARAIRREAALLRLQSDFVAAVSHEFRSPLTTVRQMAEMLEMGRLTDPSRRQQYYRALVTEASRLQRLVETLLNFGRLEAGGTLPERGPINLASTVGEVATDVARQLGVAETRIVIDAPATPVQLLGDEDGIRLALRNLIENAIKYSPSHSTVTVRWRAEGSRVAIDVIDQGAGIAPTEREAIFRKFVRGRAAREGHVKGTGVGLAIVRHIVSAHGGDILVESEIGRGSTFKLSLALQTEPARPTTDQPRPGWKAAVPSRHHEGSGSLGPAGPGGPTRSL